MNDLQKTIFITRFTPQQNPGFIPLPLSAKQAPEQKNWPTQTHDPVPIPEQPDPIPQREHGPFWRGTHE